MRPSWGGRVVALQTAALALAACCSGAEERARGRAKGSLRVQSARSRVASSAVIRKPLTDDRLYEYATLDNGLKVLVVQDQKAAHAGFGVAVEAGSFYDPPELPGLAHFCEHLLFLGTKKYPDEASFDNFMSQHDGSNNAYTAQERTVYYNQVNHAGFDEGMDRFAQFFIAPLFKGEMVGRELHAVNSEHEKNRPDQSRRMWEILRGTAGQGSVLGRFYTGTVESLHNGDASTVASLRAYHDANYCAPRMSLVTVSNLSIAEQLRAAEAHFGAVPRGSCGPTRDFGQGGRGFEPQRLGQLVRMGTKSTPALWMMFPLSPTARFYKEAPGQYLQYVLSYAGPNSLKSRLKKRGLVTDFSVQVEESSAATLLFLAFELTPQGAEEDGVGELTETTFGFLQLLAKEEGGEVPSVYDSIRKQSQVDFDYVEAPDSVMDAVSALAESVSHYAPQDVLTAPNGVVDAVNADRVRVLLSALNPKNMNMALATPGFNASSADHHEKYYDIRFSQEPVPRAWASRWAKPKTHSGLRTTPALRYVPTVLTVGNASAGEFPKELAVRSNGSQSGAPLELWWKGRGIFPLPKAQVYLRLAVRKGLSGARTLALRKLHAALVQQLLEEPTEDLRNCGLGFQTTPVSSGYLLQVSGYDQHLDTLLFQALESMLKPDFGAGDFARAHRQVLDDLQDTTRQAPYELALGELSALIIDTAFSREEVLAALRRLDEHALRGYLSVLSGEGLRAQLLVVGNVDEATSQQLAAGVASRVVKLAGGLLPVEASQRPQVIEASRPLEIRMRNPIPGDINHAIVTTYQYGVADVAERVRLLLLGKMIADPVYDGLRTKRQLGYIVFGSLSEEVNVLELRVLVQGAKEPPDVVDSDIEQVLDDFGKSLKAMKTDDFLVWKASLRSAFSQKDQNMAQEADRYWSQIVNDGHCFNRKELALRYLETLNSPDAVIKTFESLRKNRRKVTVKLFGGGLDPRGAPQPKAGGGLTPAEGSVMMLGTDGVSAAEKASLTQGLKFYPTHQLCSVSAV